MAEPREFVQLPIDETYYHAIGRVAALWSVVEAKTQELAWLLMRVSPETGRLTTAALQMETLHTALRILAETQRLAPIFRKALNAVIVETKRLSDRRNTVVHTQWDFGSKLGSAKTYSLKTKKTSEEFTPDAINEIGLEISRLLRQMGHLSVALAHTFPETVPPQRHSHESRETRGRVD
jgi:hypothetical protein